MASVEAQTDVADEGLAPIGGPGAKGAKPLETDDILRYETHVPELNCKAGC